MQQILGREYQHFGRKKGVEYNELMPKLIKAGFVPMNVADIMVARLEAVYSNDHEQKNFWLGYKFPLGCGYNFTTGDGIATNFHETFDGYGGKIKIVLDAEQLRDSKDVLDFKSYKKINAEEFDIGALNNAGLIDKLLSKEIVRSHPIWLALARGDKHLLLEYADIMFAELKQSHGKEEGMGVYIPYSRKLIAMRYWVADGISSDFCLSGEWNFSNNVHLVGKHDKNTKQKETLEEKVAIASKSN